MFSPTLLTLWVAAGGPAKLPPPLAKEMSEAVVAVDKALGLESWPSHGVQACVQRANVAENPTQDVSHDETIRCATLAVEKDFPGLGKSYVLAVLMAPMGPITVVALGIDEAQGWGAYSCDPGRKCPPMAMNPATKWGKRVIDRQAKACASTSTIWLPASKRACPPVAAAPTTPHPGPGSKPK
jgi:hypothetical protein